MIQSFGGIPNLPDLTHPNELMEFGAQILKISVQLAILVGFLGIIMALINWSNRRSPSEDRVTFMVDWLERYVLLLGKIPHFILVLTILVGGFFLCTTLANRYHHWEQARIAQVASTVSGDRLEQFAPRVRYVIKQPYSYDTWVEGKMVRVENIQDVDRFMAIARSQINVNLNQATDAANLKTIYVADFSAEYQVVNKLNEAKDFFFEIRPPNGYTLLQNFKVDQDGNRLVQINPGDYGFPFRLGPGEETLFRVTYLAQGGPRWVYNPGGESLSNFRLAALANFPKAEFASGIIPTETKAERQGTRFTWVFEDNVSVRNPFGVFTATDPVRNTGILPRLLLLAPALFIWWILMLYLSLPMSPKDVAIAGGIFFACLLSLTYFSRLIDVKLAWTLISPILLLLVWGLGSNRQTRLAGLIATIAGAVMPVWGLIVTYSGLTLSLAGLLSVCWLAVRHWYKQLFNFRF